MGGSIFNRFNQKGVCFLALSNVSFNLRSNESLKLTGFFVLAASVLDLPANLRPRLSLISEKKLLPHSKLDQESPYWPWPVWRCCYRACRSWNTATASATNSSAGRIGSARGAPDEGGVESNAREECLGGLEHSHRLFDPDLLDREGGTELTNKICHN